MSISTKQEPPLGKGHYLFGHLFSLKKEGIHFYERLHEQYGDAVRIKILTKTYYLFLHPEHNREILVDKGNDFIKGQQYKELRLILGNGLLTSQEPDWSFQRKLLNPLFGKEGMNLSLMHIKDVSQSKIDKYRTGIEMNWTKAMFDFTIDVAVKSFFGSALSDEDKELFNKISVNCIRLVSKRMSNPLALPLVIPTKENRELKNDLQYLKDTVYAVINKRAKSNQEARDMLDLLILASSSEGDQALSKKDMFDQILTFLFAGHETTAMTMSWLFYELSRHSEIQDKIIAECVQNHFEFDSSLSLNNYPYLTNVLNETMRLYPAGWVIARDIAQDSTVGDFKVRKGRVLAVCPYISHRDPRWWKEPLKFDPDRFNGEIPKNAYLPFSIGKRNCIGGRFAMLEMAVFCINFFKNYKVSESNETILPKGYVTLKPSRPINLKIIPRS